MELDEFIASRQKAIVSNFAIRNVRVTSCVHELPIRNDGRWAMIKSQRRQTVRRLIAELRLAINPRTKEAIAERVKWLS